MSIYKIPLPLNILEAAESVLPGHSTPYPAFVSHFLAQRLWFNAASDSRTCPTNGQKICVLFIDWEAQFSCTINYVSPCASCTPMSSKSFTGLRSRYDAKFPFTIPTRMAVLGT